MEDITVVNDYKKDSFLQYKFQWENNEYEIKSMPYKLVIKQTDGDEYCSIDVDSYYDCGIFIGDILFWGERLGKISGYNMKNQEMCFRTHINRKAEEFYNDSASLYPHTFPPKTGDYAYLPEINLANSVAAKLAISAMATDEKHLVVGDLSGNISLFDVETFNLINTFNVEGTVSCINIGENGIAIDYVKADHIDSPYSLSNHKEAIRTYIKL